MQNEHCWGHAVPLRCASNSELEPEPSQSTHLTRLSPFPSITPRGATPGTLDAHPADASVITGIVLVLKHIPVLTITFTSTTTTATATAAIYFHRSDRPRCRNIAIRIQNTPTADGCRVDSRRRRRGRGRHGWVGAGGTGAGTAQAVLGDFHLLQQEAKAVKLFPRQGAR